MISKFVVLSIAVNILLTAIIIYFLYRIINLEKRYKNFISKFNKEGNIEENLKNYIEMVKNVNEDNKILKANNLNLSKKLERLFAKFRGSKI